MNGAFPSGSYSDQLIFNSNLWHILLSNEKVLADKGYRGPKIVHDNVANDRSGYLGGSYKAVHERLTWSIKIFDCLQNWFRPAITEHKLCMFAVVIVFLMELSIQRIVPSFYFNDFSSINCVQFPNFRVLIIRSLYELSTSESRFTYLVIQRVVLHLHDINSYE